MILPEDYPGFVRGALQCYLFGYKVRADLMTREAWQKHRTDGVGNPLAWIVKYDCEYCSCWLEQCSSDDETRECLNCDRDLEPCHQKKWIGPKSIEERGMWRMLPLLRCSRVPGEPLPQDQPVFDLGKAMSLAIRLKQFDEIRDFLAKVEAARGEGWPFE